MIDNGASGEFSGERMERALINHDPFDLKQNETKRVAEELASKVLASFTSKPGVIERQEL